jgi:hypothetical protein
LGEDTLTFGANHNASEFKLLTYIHKKPSKWSSERRYLYLNSVFIFIKNN